MWWSEGVGDFGLCMGWEREGWAYVRGRGLLRGWVCILFFSNACVVKVWGRVSRLRGLGGGMGWDADLSTYALSKV